MYFTHPGPHSTWVAANLSWRQITPHLDEKCFKSCSGVNRMCVSVLGVILALCLGKRWVKSLCSSSCTLTACVSVFLVLQLLRLLLPVSFSLWQDIQTWLIPAGLTHWLVLIFSLQHCRPRPHMQLHQCTQSTNNESVSILCVCTRVSLFTHQYFCSNGNILAFHLPSLNHIQMIRCMKTLFQTAGKILYNRNLSNIEFLTLGIS